MPFECGLFWSCMRFGGKEHSDKSLKVLDAAPHRYHQFLSDISGGDVGVHRNRIPDLVEAIRGWLATAVTDSTRVPGGTWIVGKYLEFQQQLPAILRALPRSSLTLSARDLAKQQYYREFVTVAAGWLKSQPGFV